MAKLAELSALNSLLYQICKPFRIFVKAKSKLSWTAEADDNTAQTEFAGIDSSHICPVYRFDIFTSDTHASLKQTLFTGDNMFPPGASRLNI